MTREQAIQKVIDELMINNIVLIFNPHIFGEYMEQLYGVGFNEGHKSFNKSIKVVQMDLEGNELMEYISIADAARAMQCDESNISFCCKGKQKTAKGYTWKYKIDKP